MSRWGWVRAAVAVAVLATVGWRVGTDAFLAGLSRVDARSLAVGCGVALVTTVCCAWRWTLVARSLGVPVPLTAAVAAYYRSQFLNVATPGGVVGDVDRALRRGSAVGDTGRVVRSVVWDRVAGQVVLVAVAIAGLTVLPSPVRDQVRLAAIAVLATGFVVTLVTLAARRGGSSRPTGDRSRRWSAIPGSGDLRAVLLTRHTSSRVLLASVVALAGHVLTFLVAARTAGASAATAAVLPLALVVLLAMGLPNVAGWGPREGVAAWSFGAAGMGAQQGVTTAVVYGVIVFVGALPGAVVLLVSAAGRVRGGRRG
ncbi:hypothetical protein ASD62_02295 [Phycicoccus sp. Root563]|nr:hypothetical protein ASD62_02295 [Phycicoccus sp. Root563]